MRGGNVRENASPASLPHRVGHTHWTAQQLLTRSSNCWNALLNYWTHTLPPAGQHPQRRRAQPLPDHPRGCGKAPTAATQRHTAAQRGFTARHQQGPHSGLSGAGAGIFPQWGILKNNRKESIHETRWTSSRRRASGWIPERRHGGHAGGAVGIARRAGSCRHRGTGRHRAERHQ
jgi:hypothetical protein